MPNQKIVQIDPAHCGCTECMIHLYVPLDMASYEQVKKMLKGKLSDATSEEFIQKDDGIWARWSHLRWDKGFERPVYDRTHQDWS